MTKSNTRWAGLITINALLWCVLGFYQAGNAAPRGGKLPFSNSVEQRHEMVVQLKQINAQLREQNALFRSGKLKVILEKPK